MILVNSGFSRGLYRVHVPSGCMYVSFPLANSRAPQRDQNTIQLFYLQPQLQASVHSSAKSYLSIYKFHILQIDALFVQKTYLSGRVTQYKY